MRNFILSIFFALFLSFIAVFAQNPLQPIPGTYYILNRVLSPTGDKLAVTFQVGQAGVILTPLVKSELQKWIITLGEQFIIPKKAQSDAATGQNSLNEVLIAPKNSFVWTITRISGDTYTIADQAQFWDLKNPVNNAPISLDQSTGSPTQNWVLVSAV